jgi:hypothetical protein
MSDDIQVGDVCIVIFSVLPQHPVGSEVTILDVLSPPDCCFPNCCYVIDRSAGTMTVASARCLRKKRPPVVREALGEWGLCPWRPAVEESA